MNKYIHKILISIPQFIFLIVTFFLLNYIHKALLHVPWLSFFIFIYFLFVGIRALKTHTVPIYQYIILPIALSIWIFSEIRAFNFCNFMTIIALSFGQASSSFFISFGDITVNPQNKTVTLPGSITTLILLMSFFVIKYAFLYVRLIIPYIAQYTNLEITLFAFIAGVFMGRLFHILYRYRKKKVSSQLIFDLF